MFILILIFDNRFDYIVSKLIDLFLDQHALLLRRFARSEVDSENPHSLLFEVLYQDEDLEVIVFFALFD